MGLYNFNNKEIRFIMKSKGIWFYGLSGVGKSYISKLVHKHIKESVVVDGDLVRKLISFDLKYGKSDRKIQNFYL